MVLWIIIFILLLIIVLLVSALLYVVKKAMYLSRKEKDFLIFVIDIYIDYAEELKLNSIQEHNLIVGQLNRLKNKYLENEKK